MTRTQYFTAVSIDGFIADQDNSLDWLFEADAGSDEGRDMFSPFFEEIGAFAMGATTYEWVLEHEQLRDHPEKWQRWYGSTPGWVFTHRDLPSVPAPDSASSVVTSLRCTRPCCRPPAARTSGSSEEASWSVCSPITVCWTRSSSAWQQSPSVRERRCCRGG